MNKMDPNKIGKKLLALRGETPRSVVAKAVDISESALAMYESGQRIARDNVKIRLADYYKVSVCEIFY